MLEWLDHLPTEMEGYIRPGCIILTIFICMPIHAWEKVLHWCPFFAVTVKIYGNLRQYFLLAMCSGHAFINHPNHASNLQLCRDIEARLQELVWSSGGEFLRKGEVLVQLDEASTLIVDGR